MEIDHPTEEQIREKMAAGLTRENAIMTLQHQAEYDAERAKRANRKAKPAEK